MRNELHQIRDRKVSLYQARLRDEMPQADGTANPVLWWSRELDTEDRDWLVCGVKTKKEALEVINLYIKGTYV